MSDTNDTSEEGVNKEKDAAEETAQEENGIPELRAEPLQMASQSHGSGSSNTTILAAVIALVIVVTAGIFYVMSGSGDDEKGEETTVKVTEAPVPKAFLDELMKPGPLEEKIMGEANAPVTIIEYSSMTCPHCAHFHRDTLPALKAKYIDTGKVRYILREFPFDNLASAAFMLARCAGGDKYFPLVDALYAQQESWAFSEGDPTPALFKATQLAGAGFTKESFEACLQRQDLVDGISEVRQRAEKKFMIRSTPSFFINGQRLVGAQPLEKFEEVMKPFLEGGGS